MVVVVGIYFLDFDSTLPDPPPFRFNINRTRVAGMFYRAYDFYMELAFPRDELKPISCTGFDTFGSYSLTLVDSLDALLILGNTTEFLWAADWLAENMPSFDVDNTVSGPSSVWRAPMESNKGNYPNPQCLMEACNTLPLPEPFPPPPCSVFETNIRVLGGLVSAHLLAEEMLPGEYHGALLPLATDLGDRLLRAFRTPTGIPYGSVNLRHGVPANETTITATAGGGTFLLEMAALSRATGDDKYVRAARKGTMALYSFRHESTHLLGSHIDVKDGRWTEPLAAMGSNADSFFEYLLKVRDTDRLCIPLCCFCTLSTTTHRG